MAWIFQLPNLEISKFCPLAPLEMHHPPALVHRKSPSINDGQATRLHVVKDVAGVKIRMVPHPRVDEAGSGS